MSATNYPHLTGSPYPVPSREWWRTHFIWQFDYGAEWYLTSDDLEGVDGLAVDPLIYRLSDRCHLGVLDGMGTASREAGDDPELFVALFDDYVKQPVIANPELLRKAGWQ